MSGHRRCMHVCVRVRELTMRMYTACVRVRRSLSKAIDVTHACMVFIYMIATCISISKRLTTDSNVSPRRACTTNAPTCVSVCVRARVRVCLGAPVSAPKVRAEMSELFPIGVDRIRFGSQAFTSASAFNVDIGAWNTARVTTLYQVCAALGLRRVTAADALGRGSMRRGRCARWYCRCVRASLRAHMYGHSVARVSTCVRIAARRKGRIYVCIYVVSSAGIIYTYANGG